MAKDACTGEYKDLIGIYLTKIDTATSEYASLCADATHTYLLMEYNNVETTAQFGIFDVEAGTWKNYTKTGDAFTEVQ